MKISDVITLDNGIFAAIERTMVGSETIFAGYHMEELDLDFLSNYGERPVAPIVKMCNGDIDKLARAIANRYKESWMRQHAALLSDYDVTKPYRVTETTKETRESKLDNEANDSVTNQVAGFDSDIQGPVDSDNSATVHKSNQAGTDTISREYSKDGITAGVSISSLIEAEIRLRRQNFISLVMGDIKNFTTLSIY